MIEMPSQHASGERDSATIRRARLLAAAALSAAAFSGCGGSSNDAGSPAIAEAAASNVILNIDSDALALHGEFARVDGYLSASPKVLKGATRGANARFRLEVSQPGYYEVFAWWPQKAPSGSLAQLQTTHRDGIDVRTFDQSVLGGQWNSLGVFALDVGGAGSVTFTQVGAAPLLVDAIRIQYVGPERPALEIRSAELPVAELDRGYEAPVVVYGGKRPYHLRVVSGELPPGLTLDDERDAVVGRPAIVGGYRFQLEASDAGGDIATVDASIEVVETSDVNPAVRTVPGALATKSITETLLDVVAALPEGEWSRVNLNNFSDVWPPADLRPLYGWGNPTPSKIILAWSSFAWDMKRQSLFLYGGGHANYRGNDTYIWRGATRRWERASLSSEMKQDPLGNWNAIDGADAAPASAHTYDNTLYLPIVDRILVLGGAADSNGAHYLRQATQTTSRKTGPYLFDPSRAHPDKVGGTTGSHVQRVAPYPEIVGGNMWSNRENYLNATPPPQHAFVNGCTGYAEENGRDVVYVRTSAALHRYTIQSLSEPSLDTWEQVGVYWNGPGSQTTCAYDPFGRTLVRTGTNSVPFVYWNLNTPGPNNRDVTFSPDDPTSEFAALRASTGFAISRCALDFDTKRRTYALWCGGGTVWTLEPPATLSPAGWSIRKQRNPVLPVPNGDVGTGILGKWKYAPGLDVFIGLQDAVQGNVWVYKPAGWQGGGSNPEDPPPSNLPPTVSLLQPSDGSVFPGGSAIVLEAQAADSDGTVQSVEFYSGATRIGATSTPPYAWNWMNPPLGTHTLTAVATDDAGARAVSSAVALTVTDPGTIVGATVLLQQGVNGYALATDTYLSSYHTTTAFGGATLLQDTGAAYSGLVRFAIFQSEGGPVPNGATIRSAKLSLYKYTSYDVTYDLLRILPDWSADKATWNQRTASAAWAMSGANAPDLDVSAAADATASVGFAPGWIEFDVTGAVQRLSSGSAGPNFGWRLKAVKGNLQNTKRFYSSNYSANPELRPKLLVTYE